MVHHVALRLRAYDPVEPVVDTCDVPAPPHAVTRTVAHLTQWFVAHDGEVEAHYRFDDVYAAAHPEALDRAQLAMLAALLTFKLFDDGEVLIGPQQLAGVLRWPTVEEPRRALAGAEG